VDPYKYIKNRIPGLVVYPIVEGGKEYFRLQFGQPSNISPDYKGKKTQFFPRTEQGLKDLAAEYNRRKPFVIPSLSRAEAAKAGSQKMTDFIEIKKGYSQDLLKFIEKNSTDPKYKVSNGPSKLYDDAVKFFKKDKKYTSVPEGFSKTANQTYEFLKGRNFQLPRNYEITEGFKMTGNFPRHPEQIKSLMAVKLLENNPNFVNINEMASKFYLTDVDRKELLKENKELVKATSGFLGRNKIRKDSAAGKYLQKKGFDFNKKLYEVIQFRTLEEDIIDKLGTNISNAERVRLENSLAVIQRNRGTVFKKLKTEFPNLTKGNAMVLEHATPQGLINTGTFYPKTFMLKAQYVPQAFNQFKNTQFDTPLIKLVYQYNNETDPSIKQSLKSEIQDLRKNFNNRTKVDGKAYFSSLDQKTVGIRDKRYPIDKLKLDVPQNKKLDLFVKTVINSGNCRNVIAKAIGGEVSTCEAVIRQDPERAAQKILQVEGSTGPLTKVKNAALGFLKSPGAKTFGIGAGVGAAIGLVKAFRNDDPSTYLSNEDQQKNMLVDMATQPVSIDIERPAILDYQLPALGGTLAASTALAAPSTIKASKSRALGIERKPKGFVKTGLRVLGRGLGVAASPALLAPFAVGDIASQIAEGDTPEDIATNPFNYLYPAFADQTPKLTRGLSPTIRKVARLGLPRAALTGLSRVGIGGLAASLAIQGSGLFDD
jgi:hypothetical protein